MLTLEHDRFCHPPQTTWGRARAGAIGRPRHARDHRVCWQNACGLPAPVSRYEISS